MANTKNLKPFKKGQSGNPGGKPVGARNRVTTKFLETLADDFEEHGKAAIESARADDPLGYMRVVASLLPKEFVIEKPLDGLTDAELSEAIAQLRDMLSAAQAPGARDGEAGGAEQTRGVSSLH